MNAVMIGVEADWTNSDTRDAFYWIEFSFLVLFTIEIMLKLFGFGRLFWTDTWNLIDFTIVAASIMEVGLHPPPLSPIIVPRIASCTSYITLYALS